MLFCICLSHNRYTGKFVGSGVCLLYSIKNKILKHQLLLIKKQNTGEIRFLLRRQWPQFSGISTMSSNNTFQREEELYDGCLPFGWWSLSGITRQDGFSKKEKKKVLTIITDKRLTPISGIYSKKRL